MDPSKVWNVLGEESDASAIEDHALDAGYDREAERDRGWTPDPQGETEPGQGEEKKSADSHTHVMLPGTSGHAYNLS